VQSRCDSLLEVSEVYKTPANAIYFPDDGFLKISGHLPGLLHKSPASAAALSRFGFAIPCVNKSRWQHPDRFRLPFARPSKAVRVKGANQPREDTYEAHSCRSRPGADPVSPVATVTASDSGIGQEAAKKLAENGFDVGITYCSRRSRGRRGEVRRLDLTDYSGSTWA
jgi:hypothetical protein